MIANFIVIINLDNANSNDYNNLNTIMIQDGYKNCVGSITLPQGVFHRQYNDDVTTKSIENNIIFLGNKTNKVFTWVITKSVGSDFRPLM